MITFKNLGKYGWLGNQMFQFSFLYGVGKKKGIEIGYDFKNNPIIAKIFKLPAQNSNNIIPKFMGIEKNDFAYFNVSNVEDGTDFIGYFQNKTYVEENELDLKKIFIFDEEKHKICYDFMKKLKEKVNRELVGIHVRRTDFLLIKDTHFVCDVNYFKKAIDCFGPSYFFVIFTDDPKWCSETFKNLPNIIMNNDAEKDIILMSLCDHNIISNSSYSWWGSWLNENNNKKIIAPNRWYNKRAPKNWQEIYRKDMVLI